MGPERHGRHGHVQRYEHGRMYWSDHTGAHFVLAPMVHMYVHLGESASALGLPISDTREDTADNGHHNLFQHGSIHVSHDTNPHAVWGPVFREWSVIGMTKSPLGLPVTDTLINPDGAGQHNDFKAGSIYYSPSYGAHAVPDPVHTWWDAHDREAGPLGYPVDDLTDLPQQLGQTQSFQYGVVDVTPTSTHAVWGPIFDVWASQYGRESGSLGMPLTDVYAVDPTHDRCDFQNGSLVLDKTTGTVSETQ
jgi:uncharacterized protein with LGFP repeats